MRHMHRRRSLVLLFIVSNSCTDSCRYDLNYYNERVADAANPIRAQTSMKLSITMMSRGDICHSTSIFHRCYAHCDIGILTSLP